MGILQSGIIGYLSFFFISNPEWASFHFIEPDGPILKSFGINALNIVVMGTRTIAMQIRRGSAMMEVATMLSFATARGKFSFFLHSSSQSTFVLPGSLSVRRKECRLCHIHNVWGHSCSSGKQRKNKRTYAHNLRLACCCKIEPCDMVVESLKQSFVHSFLTEQRDDVSVEWGAPEI